MITIVIRNDITISTKGRNGWQYKEGYGLSTDVVHNADGTISIPGIENPFNAMPFLAMDTLDIYLYDAENDTWLPQQ